MMRCQNRHVIYPRNLDAAPAALNPLAPLVHPCGDQEKAQLREMNRVNKKFWKSEPCLSNNFKTEDANDDDSKGAANAGTK